MAEETASLGIIDNSQYSHLDDVLKQGLSEDGVDRIRIAVGYLYMSGLKRLRPELDEFLDNGGELQILIGNQNKRGLEELVAAYENLQMADTEYRDESTVRWGDRPEVFEETKETYGNQVLYEPPTEDNQEFFQQLTEWLTEGSVNVKLYMEERFHAKAYLFERREGNVFQPSEVGIIGSSNLSISGLRSNTELNAPVYHERVEQLKEWFDRLWDEAESFRPHLLDTLQNSWVTQTPPEQATSGESEDKPGLADPYHVYVKALWELYSESLQTAEDYVQSFDVYEDLYEFQKWAVNRGIRIVNQYGGVLVSDVVGMGKTFVGLGLLEHFHARNRLRGQDGKMLIICPKHLQPMWERMVHDRYNFHAEVISQGMLSKEEFGEVLLERHDDATVCLIDEAHHYRNSDSNRYRNLRDYLPVVNQTILLTATPYAKSAMDVYNQLKLFHIEDITEIPITPPNLRKFVDEVEDGDADLSDLLSHVMIRRTREDIISQYGETDDEGQQYLEMESEKRYLPDRHLRTVEYNLRDAFRSTATGGASIYSDIINTLEDLQYARYALGTDEYLRPSYQDQMPYQNLASGGKSILGLMKANLLKRLESGISAFYTTLTRMLRSYRAFRNLLDDDIVAAGDDIGELVQSGEQLDYILDQYEEMEEGEESPYETNAFYLDKLKQNLDDDIDLLSNLRAEIEPFLETIQKDYSDDDKAEQLRQLVVNLRYGTHDVLREHDSAEKIIVFSQFSDTVKHLEAAFNQFQEVGRLPDDFRVEAVTSDTSNVDDVIERFAPEANNAEEIEEEIDVLIATDVAGEGVNLQDANFVINYDLHWNPLKLIQRIGRVDRLGSEHANIYAFNFFPERELEEELEIVDRVGERVEEIGRVLGEDGAILSEKDQIKRSYMEDIYANEDFESVEEDVDEILGSDDLIGPAADLQDVRDETPELLKDVKERAGLRSAMTREKQNDAVMILYRQGDYVTPYLIEFDDEGATETVTDRREDVIDSVACEQETPIATVDRESFVSRFAQAYDIAQKQFAYDMGQRQQFEQVARRRESQDRDYVLEGLESVFESIDNVEQRRTIERYQEIIQTVTADRILDDFSDLRREKISGQELVDAVVEIISRYNLEDKYAKREEWREQQDEPPHVAAGMYLVGST